MGVHLAKRIVRRPMCDSQKKKACLHDGNAVRQLRQWLSVYQQDVDKVDESKSGKMIHFYARRAIWQQQMKDNYTQYKDNFCETHLLFHKATSEYTVELDKNKVLNGNNTTKR